MEQDTGAFSSKMLRHAVWSAAHWPMGREATFTCGRLASTTAPTGGMQRQLRDHATPSRPRGGFARFTRGAALRCGCAGAELRCQVKLAPSPHECSGGLGARSNSLASTSAFAGRISELTTNVLAHGQPSERLEFAQSHVAERRECVRS